MLKDTTDMQVPVLMYHALEDAEHPAGAQDPGTQLYVLKAQQFREQMAYLKREGYQVFLIQELLSLEIWPQKAVVLTFDDGHQSNSTLALPILKEHGFKAHFFVTTGWTGTSGFMTEKQIRWLHESGIDIGSHGMSHRFLPDLSEAEVAFELTRSKATLEAYIEAPVTSMSYPGGRMDSWTHRVAEKAGYSSIFSSVPKTFKLNASPSLIGRFAITAGMTLENFESLIQGRASRMFLFRHTFLAILKSLLGNRLYTLLRTTVIGSKRVEGVRD